MNRLKFAAAIVGGMALAAGPAFAARAAGEDAMTSFCGAFPRLCAQDQNDTDVGVMFQVGSVLREINDEWYFVDRVDRRGIAPFYQLFYTQPACAGQGYMIATNQIKKLAQYDGEAFHIPTGPDIQITWASISTLNSLTAPASCYSSDGVCPRNAPPCQQLVNLPATVPRVFTPPFK